MEWEQNVEAGGELCASVASCVLSYGSDPGLLEEVRKNVTALATLERRQQLQQQALNEEVRRLNGLLEAGDTDALLQQLEELPERVEAEEQRLSLADSWRPDVHPRCLSIGQLIDAHQATSSNRPADDDDATTTTADDEQLVGDSVDAILVDPWTQQAITRPFRNKHCRHLYDYESLDRVLQMRGKKTARKCPHVGCTNRQQLRWDDIVEDLVMKRAIEQRSQNN